MQRKLLLLLLLTVGTTDAFAQTSQRWSVQGSALVAALFGKAFDDVKDGFGGELQIRNTPGAWSFGGGLQFTKHSTSGDGSIVIPNVSLAGVFFEPRRVLDVGSSKIAPYISGRFALSRMSFSFADGIDESLFDVDEPIGPTINAGGGVLIRLGSRVNLDLGITVGYTHFGDAKLTDKSDGTTLTVPFGNGKNAVLRAGFAIGLGG